MPLEGWGRGCGRSPWGAGGLAPSPLRGEGWGEGPILPRWLEVPRSSFARHPGAVRKCFTTAECWSISSFGLRLSRYRDLAPLPRASEPLPRSGSLFFACPRTRFESRAGSKAEQRDMAGPGSSLVGAHLCATAALGCTAPLAGRAQVRSYKGDAGLCAADQSCRLALCGGAPCATNLRSDTPLRGSRAQGALPQTSSRGGARFWVTASSMRRIERTPVPLPKEGPVQHRETINAST